MATAVTAAGTAGSNVTSDASAQGLMNTIAADNSQEYATEEAAANFQVQNMEMSTYAEEQNTLQDTLTGIAQTKEQQAAAMSQAQRSIQEKYQQEITQ